MRMQRKTRTHRLGSLPTCGDAAAALQRNFTRTLLPDDARQPEPDMRMRHAVMDVASARLASQSINCGRSS